jgi:CheY-like chemotaxis protein
MNVIVVEDDIREVEGYLRLIKVNGWGYKRFTTFSDAYKALAEHKEPVDCFLIDIMLPWGEKVPEEIAVKIDWKKAGVVLIYGIRNIDNDELEKIRKVPELSKRLDGYAGMPIIALTKIGDLVEDELDKIPNVLVVRKALGMNRQTFFAFLCGEKGVRDEQG